MSSTLCQLRSFINCRYFGLQQFVFNQSVTVRSLCSCSTSITRIKKSVYPRMYKVSLQQPDGSSYTIRYHEPRELIRVPVDPKSLTDEEKQARINRLRPEKEIEVHEFDDEETEIIKRSWKYFVASR